MRTAAVFTLAVIGLSLQAQPAAPLTYKPAGPKDKFCPRMEENDPSLFDSARRNQTRSPGSDALRGPGLVPVDAALGAALIPPEKRKSAATFTVQDNTGKSLGVAAQKGKAVAVVFWQVSCGPSLDLLLELADLQKREDKFGFVAWPVNYDTDRWVRAKPFIEKNRKSLGEARLFVPALGEQGTQVLAPALEALPAWFILDRQGRVAVQATGFEPKALVNALKKVLMED
jgi:hypothetical protein